MTREMKIRIGAVSCPAEVNNLAANLAVINNWAGKAARAGVKLLLFPELSLTGYATGGAPPTALSPGAHELDAVAQLARRYCLTLAVGLVWQENPAKPPYLAHGLWTPTGQVHLYYKSHLGERERKYYAAGDCLPVFSLPEVRVGFQLCLEQHYPEITQTLALRGAELILCPHATPRLTPAERRDSWHISLRARAYDNCVYVLATNMVGDNGQGVEYPGGLLLVDPAGQVVAEDFSGRPAMIVDDIDLSLVVNVRSTPQGMCRRFYAPSRRPELYE